MYLQGYMVDVFDTVQKGGPKGTFSVITMIGQPVFEKLIIEMSVGGILFFK
jgi:hypothetical protein